MSEQRTAKAGTVRVACPAYAKINLYLDVLSCREDGFHELLSVMHALALHDDVILHYTPAPTREISLSVFGARLPVDRRNLAYRAAEAFFEESGLSARVHIAIRKKLPIAAGLAGGSSDAAATLRALNRAAGSPLDMPAMLALAASLGSDVPFCLVGGTQLCRGRGERMQALACKAPLYAVVAIGRERVSTAQAFAEMDAYYHRFDGTVPHGGDPDGVVAAISAGTLSQGTDLVYNAFEPVVLPHCPAAVLLRQRMLELGAYAAHMSGSGPSVFGLFHSLEEARRAAKALGPNAHATTSAPDPAPAPRATLLPARGHARKPQGEN